MSKPVLYVFGNSVWSAAAELGAAELFPEPGAIEYKTIDLMNGENFAPSFLDKNPKGTLPTLEAQGQVYSTTAEVTSYLVKNSPTNTKAANAELIELIHSDKYDPNFILFLARNEEEFEAKAEFAAIYFGNRQAALKKYSVLPEARAHKSFYERKLASNGGSLALFQGTLPQAVKDGYFSRSQAHFENVKTFLSGSFVSHLPESGFIGGDFPGEDDYHVCAWLTRVAASVGAKSKDDSLVALEKAFGGPILPKVVSYWGAWTDRPSWAKVYSALH